jgi:hypothetical protein
MYGVWAQQFSIPAGAELLESTEFKNNGITYVVEQRYRLRSGEILYAYYNVEGQSSVTIQKIEETPILALGIVEFNGKIILWLTKYFYLTIIY